MQLPAHVVAADDEEYKPAMQVWHTVAATDGENVPASHGRHAVIPRPEEYVPAAQLFEQVEAPVAKE